MIFSLPLEPCMSRVPTFCLYQCVMTHHFVLQLPHFWSLLGYKGNLFSQGLLLLIYEAWVLEPGQHSQFLPEECQVN